MRRQWLAFPVPCIAIGFEAAVQDLTDRISTAIKERGQVRIAVVDFTDLNGAAFDLGKFLAEEVSSRLAPGDNIQLVERRLIRTLAEEMKYQRSGMIDPRAAKRLRGQLGVDALCTGKVTELQRTVRIHARLIDTENGRVFAAASVKILKSELPSVWLSGMPDEIKASMPPRCRKGSDYLVNGGFQNQLNAWTRGIGNLTEGVSQTEITSLPHGRLGKALHIRHQGDGHIQYSQMVSVPGPDLVFSVSFQPSVQEGPLIGFSGTGVVQIGLRYFDRNGSALDETLLVS
ncbi:MAG: FlgO family outer membrane protein [Syntrophales bacterium]